MTATARAARRVRLSAIAIGSIVFASATTFVSPKAGAAGIDISVEPTNNPYITDVISLQGDYPGLRPQYNKDPKSDLCTGVLLLQPGGMRRPDKVAPGNRHRRSGQPQARKSAVSMRVGALQAALSR